MALGLPVKLLWTVSKFTTVVSAVARLFCRGLTSPGTSLVMMGGTKAGRNAPVGSFFGGIGLLIERIDSFDGLAETFDRREDPPNLLA